MLFEEILREVIEEYNTDFSLTKNGGQKDFKKIAQKGIEVNPLKNQDGSDFSFGDLIKSVPGARYPRDNRSGKIVPTENLKSIEDDIMYTLGLGEADYKDKFLFAYGVHRMIYDGEVKTELDKKTLSNICIYLSENPNALSTNLNRTNIFNDRNWSSGIANFYGMSFLNLKKKFAKPSKEYVGNKTKKKLIKSKIISSNGYYVYPCYTFQTANMIGSTFRQGMCFFNSPTFWFEHTGNVGGLFMFKKIRNDYSLSETKGPSLFYDNTSLGEIVISTNIDDSGNAYIDGITNGYNITLYNEKYHEIKGKKSDFADNFTQNDIKNTSAAIGLINGREVFEYCIYMTNKKQDKKYEPIFKEKNFNIYTNLSNKNLEKKVFDKEYNLTIFENDGRLYCLLNNTKDVIIVEKKGFITCNGKEVKNTDHAIIKRLEKYIPIFFKDWGGFRRNNRNKGEYFIQ